MTLALAVSGSAVPASDNWLRRLDARWKILGIAIAVLAAASCVGRLGVFAWAAGALTLALGGGLSFTSLVKRLAPVWGMLTLFFVWSVFRASPEETPWSLAGLSLAPSAAWRFVRLLGQTTAIVVLILTLLESTSLPDLGHGAARLGAPRIFIHLLLMTHRYVFVLAEEFARLRRALRTRGYRNRFDRRGVALIGSAAGTLFVRGHERAERVHHAMMARGFDGSFRTLSASRTRFLDVAFFVAMTTISFFTVAWDRGWWPS